MFKENEWQRFRQYLPHMTTMARESKPKDVEEFRQYCFDHIDFDKLFDEAQIYNKALKDYCLDKAIDKTYKGWVMEERAEEIITSYGWEIDPITEEEDRKGIDIKAHKDGVKLNIQVKPQSILTTLDKYAQRKRYNLFHGTDVKLMIYRENEFMKFGNKYLVSPRTLFDEKGNTITEYWF